MDEEFRKRVADYFTPAELVDLLDVPIEELVDLLSEHIENNQEMIEEYVAYGTR